MQEPTVHVIAFTKFNGNVPEELWPNCTEPNCSSVSPLHRAHNETYHKQNKGSDFAKLIEVAGRTCYDSYGIGRGSADFHENILKVGHGSVLEHASLTFFITGVSRGLTHELVRHRVGVAISQRSTRYVDESESPWIFHPLLHKKGVNYEKALELAKEVEEYAKKRYTTIAFLLQHQLSIEGESLFNARKQARGAARGVLGNALETTLVWTTNIRTLRNCIEQRASGGADAEIRVLFNKLWEVGKEYCPEYLRDYVKVECKDGIGYELVTKNRKI